MDFKELTYVLAIAEHNSITKAAKSLYLSQPTLTKFLQQLEDNLGQRLFDRVGKKLIPTYAGDRYIARASEILAIKRDLQQELSDIAKDRTGRLRIGFSSIRTSDILLHVVPAFMKQYPNIQLSFRELNAATYEHYLLSGELDLAFFNLPIDSPHISYQVLAYEEIILVAPADHPLAAKAQYRPGCRYPWIDLSWAKDDVFIMISNELRIYSIIQTLLNDAKISPKILFYTKNIDIACILASEGYGLAFSSEQHIKHSTFEHAPAIFSIGNPCTQRTFIAAMRKDSYLPNYAQAFINLVKENSCY